MGFRCSWLKFDRFLGVHSNECMLNIWLTASVVRMSSVNTLHCAIQMSSNLMCSWVIQPFFKRGISYNFMLEDQNSIRAHACRFLLKRNSDHLKLLSNLTWLIFSANPPEPQLILWTWTSCKDCSYTHIIDVIKTIGLFIFVI